MTKIKINKVQIGEFLKKLTTVEYQYLKISMSIRDGIETLIDDYDMDKESILKAFELKDEQYQNFISGNYAYAISHMATINHLLFTFRAEKLKETQLFKVAK